MGGSKSQAFDPTALWLLVDYIVSEAAGPIRSQLTEEVVRLIDGYCAIQAHQNLAAVTSKEVARRLVPISGRDLRNPRRPLRGRLWWPRRQRGSRPGAPSPRSGRSRRS